MMASHTTNWRLVSVLLHVLDLFSTLVDARVDQRHLDITAAHLQSGPDSQGGSFASAGYVDGLSQTLHVVGTTYGKWWVFDPDNVPSSGADDPACFYAVAQLPKEGVTTTSRWIHSELIGVSSVEEGCRDLLMDMVEKRAYVVGHSETNGLLAEFFDDTVLESELVKQVGTILDFAFGSTSGPSPRMPLVLKGGRIIQDSLINYPVAIAGVPGGDKFYVATMYTRDIAPNQVWQAGQQMDPGQFFRYGSKYSMGVSEHKRVSNQISNAAGSTLQRSVGGGVAEIFETTGKEDVNVATLLLLPDRILVAGYTEGTGTGFDGTAAPDVGNMDGFVTQLGLVDLKPLSSNPTFRISSGEDDYVTGLCFSPQTAAFAYVTGFTKGRLESNAGNSDGSTRGFAMKLKLEDMTTVWVREFDAAPANENDPFVSKAVSCALTEDGNNLYVAGIVEDGASMEDGDDTVGDSVPQSFGGTDVWVSQIATLNGSTDDGKVLFVKQFGSAADETVAYRGGIQADANDNAVLVGNTQGDIYRVRDDSETVKYSDVFVATFLQGDGSFVLPLEHDDFVSLPPLPPIAAVTPAPAVAPTPTPPPAPPTPNDDKEDDGGEGFPVHSLLLMLVLVVMIVACVTRFNGLLQPKSSLLKRDMPTDRTKVLHYLHDFDVEDVELKQSATGGWHCSYQNDLSKGINNQQAKTRSAMNRTRSSRSMTTPEKASSAMDPLTSRGLGGAGGSGDDTERFADEILSVDGDEDVIAFGTSRLARRERRSAGTGFFRDRKARARSSNNSSSGSSSVSSNSTSSSSNRRNRARERWQNREII